MKLQLSMQYAAPRVGLPAKSSVNGWVLAALRGMAKKNVAVNVRFVGGREGAALNRRYRGKAGSTNVLSFPFDGLVGAPSDYLGDLVLCAPVVQREVKRAHCPEKAYWAHMVIHGILHLRGYDHKNSRDAAIMENLEIRVLKGLGFSNPYAR